MRIFVQCQADAPNDSADELALCGLFIQQASDIISRDDATHTDRTDLRVDGDLREDGSEGVTLATVIEPAEIGASGSAANAGINAAIT